MRSRYCELSCDYNESPDCREYAGPERTMAELIKDAKKAGWFVGPVGAESDTCPECMAWIGEGFKKAAAS